MSIHVRYSIELALVDETYCLLGDIIRLPQELRVEQKNPSQVSPIGITCTRLAE